MNNRRRFPRIFFVLSLFGVMNLLAMLSSPAWANIRGVDVVRLIGTGMNFGGAIVSFGAYFRDRRSSWRPGVLRIVFPMVRTTNQIRWFIKTLCSIALQDKKYAFAEDHSLVGVSSWNRLTKNRLFYGLKNTNHSRVFNTRSGLYCCCWPPDQQYSGASFTAMSPDSICSLASDIAAIYF